MAFDWRIGIIAVLLRRAAAQLIQYSNSWVATGTRPAVSTGQARTRIRTNPPDRLKATVENWLTLSWNASAVWTGRRVRPGIAHSGNDDGAGFQVFFGHRGDQREGRRDDLHDVAALERATRPRPDRSARRR